MGAFDRWSPDQNLDRPSEAAVTDAPARVVTVDAVVETRSRGEVYADLRQAVESGWDRFRRYDAPRAELARFEEQAVRLPRTTPEDAAHYVERHRSDRPWLEAASKASPEARRIIAALDQGAGHAHIRHEGWVTEEASRRRVAYLEDPAQLDPENRPRGIDGLASGDKRHVCGLLATRITDPDAFATAFARGTAHPAVRAALATPYDHATPPDPVRVPIADLLGADGHKFCTGWQLEPGEGSMNAARANRKAWRNAMADGRSPDGPEPQARPVPTFEDGSITFLIGSNGARDGYEIVTLFPRPRDRELPAG